jgi:uncharacterized protein (TIGR02145 family)
LKNNQTILLQNQKVMIRNALIILSVFALVLFSHCKNEDPSPNPNINVPAQNNEPIDFGSATYGSVTDGEGNSYKTIVIGNATWMAENLKVTKFRNGDAIDKGQEGSTWISTTTPAYYSYGDHQDQISLYGYLYNSFAKSDPRSVCPSGWHVPALEDWSSAATALGGSSIAGDKMKEKGKAHWITTNNSTNESGFTGMPGGSLHNGNLADVGTDGYWWSTGTGDFFYLTNSMAELRHKDTAAPDEALSIRCVKD